MYKLANGWTKESVMEQFKKYNNGNMARDYKRGICVYQTDDGNRCAIGAFIPDGHEGLQFEGPVNQLLMRYSDLKSYIPFDDLDALEVFQQVHDGSFSGLDIYQRIENFLRDMLE